VKVRLMEDRSCLEERTLLGQSPLHLSADWPVGISLILAHGGRELVDTVDSAGFLPVSYASYRRCLEGVKLLLEAGSALYSEVVGDFETRCYIHDVLLDAMFNSSDEIVQCLIWHTADRRKQLHQLAMEVDPTR
jgi:ankyrin repeat protein